MHAGYIYQHIDSALLNRVYCSLKEHDVDTQASIFYVLYCCLRCTYIPSPNRHRMYTSYDVITLQ